MKESLAHCLSGPINLDEKDWERPVDRLHALAAMQRPEMVLARHPRMTTTEAAEASHIATLGVNLIWFRDAHGPRAYKDCISGLSKAIVDNGRLRIRQGTAELIADMAMKESGFALCDACGGRRDVKDGPCCVPNLAMMMGREKNEGAIPMMICPDCHGAGVRKYTDDDRGALARFSAAFDYAHATINHAIREAVAGYSWLRRE